jgi:hypothetical protein
MTVSKIWKEHTFPRGKNKGEQELFRVQPRAENGMYSVKKLGHRTNRVPDDYDDAATLDEVLQLLQMGRSVRMRGDASNEWNTLNNKGIEYA